MSKILFIEDDTSIAKGVIFNFEQTVMSVVWASNLNEAKTMFHDNDISLILTDLNLPDGNGLDFCKEIRQANLDIPIIIMTARVHEEAVLEGFEAGANDYIKKPFSNKEMIARVKANLPKSTEKNDLVTFSCISVKEYFPEFIFKNKSISLTPSQHTILYTLVKNSERVVTRESLLNKIGSSEDVNDRTIDSHLSQLRRKLKISGIDDISIKSVYGLGYRIEEK